MLPFLLLFSVVYCSEILSNQNLALTIYNDGYGIIKDIRTVRLDPEQSYLSVAQMAATMQPETVVFRPIKGGQKIKVLEQNFQNNLIDKSALLKKYINKQVILFTPLNPYHIIEVKGVLLAYSPSYILKTSNGVQIFDEIYGVILSNLPDGLLLMPSLLWKVRSPFNSQVTTQCQIAYRATGFSWKADYNVIVSNDEKSIDLTGWVTIDNGSGKRYKEAKIKLIAGQVHTVPKPRMYRRFRMAMSKGFSGGESQSAPLVTQKSFGDYHMYTVSNRISINGSSVKQIQFIPTIKGIPIRKYYLVSINTGGTEQDIQSYNMISFNNSKQNKVGIPLPKGDVKLLKEDSEDGQIELLKEGSINHSPKNELVKLNSGSNSFISIKKKIKSKQYKLDRSWNTSVELSIANKFEKPVQVEVVLRNSFGDNLQVKVTEGKEFVKQSIYERKTTVQLKAGEVKKIEWVENYDPSI